MFLYFRFYYAIKNLVELFHRIWKRNWSSAGCGKDDPKAVGDEAPRPMGVEDESWWEPSAAQENEEDGGELLKFARYDATMEFNWYCIFSDVLLKALVERRWCSDIDRQTRFQSFLLIAELALRFFLRTFIKFVLVSLNLRVEAVERQIID